MVKTVIIAYYYYRLCKYVFTLIKLLLSRSLRKYVFALIKTIIIAIIAQICICSNKTIILVFYYYHDHCTILYSLVVVLYY